VRELVLHHAPLLRGQLVLLGIRRSVLVDAGSFPVVVRDGVDITPVGCPARPQRVALQALALLQRLTNVLVVAHAVRTPARVRELVLHHAPLLRGHFVLLLLLF